MRRRRRALRSAQPGLGHALIDGALDQDAAARRAGLAAILDDGVDQHRQRCLDVGVGEDDLRRLAAEFHGDAAIVDGRRLLDRRAGRRRAGEGDVVDHRMRRKRRASLAAVAGDDVEDAVGKPASSASSAMRMAVSEASSAGFTTSVLPMASAAPATRARNLQRIVPGNDAGHHAMRLAQRQRGVAVEERNRVAVDLVAGAAIELVVAHGGGDIRPALPQRLAGVARFQRGKFVARSARRDEKASSASARARPPASGSTAPHRRRGARRRRRGRHRPDRKPEWRQTPCRRTGRRRRCARPTANRPPCRPRSA